MDEGVEIVTRCVVRGEKLQSLVNLLSSLYGASTEVDRFEDRLAFRPREEVGNMNYVNRDCLVAIQYSGNDVLVTQRGSASNANKDVKMPPNTEIYAVKQSKATNPNVRRTFLKAGFKVTGDFATKGLAFKTRSGFTITVARPYNAALSDTMYGTGKSAWESLSGAHPFGQDYLLEVKRLVSTQEEIDESVESINQLLERFAI